jgi:hypothetical protein
MSNSVMKDMRRTALNVVYKEETRTACVEWVTVICSDCLVPMLG